ncbi:RNA pseudouridine synthase 5-like [Rutidosis leptorrhynchoides]|uniref:RNA pseudouridine synthase 5-like n=1 Tax=Rutidosis leptorrhynchoides TaxID=125765 RepID=UPI003A993528
MFEPIILIKKVANAKSAPHANDEGLGKRSKRGVPMSKLFGLPWPENNDGLLYNDVVRPSSDSELTLIEFYSKKHNNSAPFQGWLQRIQNGQITLDGRVVKDPKTIVRAGSKLVYHRLPWKEPDAPYMLQVLYEDADLIALNKPSGVQVLPGGLFQQRTVLTQLQWLKSKQISSINAHEPHPVPVHRLGRGTSGILLCAKTKLAKTRLAAYFADGTSTVEAGSDQSIGHGVRRKITKVYRALASGIIAEDKISINQPIGLIRYPGVAKGLHVASTSGKPALSKVEVLEREVERNCTLVQVEIQSGRPHQIRIHLAFIGHPLLGDPLYISGGIPKSLDCELMDNGSFEHDGGYQRPAKPVPGDCGYHLHAHQVVLSLPTTNQEIKIVAPLPPILQSQKELNLCFVACCLFYLAMNMIVNEYKVYSIEYCICSEGRRAKLVLTKLSSFLVQKTARALSKKLEQTDEPLSFPFDVVWQNMCMDMLYWTLLS